MYICKHFGRQQAIFCTEDTVFSSGRVGYQVAIVSNPTRAEKKSLKRWGNVYGPARRKFGRFNRRPNIAMLVWFLRELEKLEERASREGNLVMVYGWDEVRWKYYKRLLIPRGYNIMFDEEGDEVLVKYPL